MSELDFYRATLYLGRAPASRTEATKVGGQLANAFSTLGTTVDSRRTESLTVIHAFIPDGSEFKAMGHLFGITAVTLTALLTPPVVSTFAPHLPPDTVEKMAWICGTIAGVGGLAFVVASPWRIKMPERPKTKPPEDNPPPGSTPR